MTGQPGRLCGRCGEALTAQGCGCGWAASDAETAVIPVIGGPELARPYFQPTPAEPTEPDEPAGHPAAAALTDGQLPFPQQPSQSSQPLPPPQPSQQAEQPEVVQATRVLPAYLPVPRPTGPVVGIRPTPLPVPSSDRRSSSSSRSSKSSRPRPARSTVLIGVGIVLVAGVGVTAALLPKMLGGNPSVVANVQPGVVVPLPTPPSSSAAAPAGTTSGSTSPSSTAAVHTTSSSAPSASPSRRSASPTPTPTATPTPSATASDSASPSPSSSSSENSTDSGTLQLGDSGSAVETLQHELRELWVAPGLKQDGYYGPATEAAVGEFQIWYGVQGDPSGVFGTNSQAAMARAMQQDGDD